MRNMLAFLAALILTVGGLGWYLDWFQVRNQPAPAGKRTISIDFDTAKIGADLHKGEEKVQKMLDNQRKDQTPGAAIKGGTKSDAPAKDAPPKARISPPASF